MTKSITILMATLALCLFTITGCGSDSSDEGDSESSTTEETTSGETSAEDDIKAALAELSDEDAEAAKKQDVCVVSGEKLGSMGTPLKVDVKGQQVWICCEGCKEPLTEKPDEFLAKLKDE